MPFQGDENLPTRKERTDNYRMIPELVAISVFLTIASFLIAFDIPEDTTLFCYNDTNCTKFCDNLTGIYPYPSNFNKVSNISDPCLYSDLNQSLESFYYFMISLIISSFFVSISIILCIFKNDKIDKEKKRHIFFTYVSLMWLAYFIVTIVMFVIIKVCTECWTDINFNNGIGFLETVPKLTVFIVINVIMSIDYLFIYPLCVDLIKFCNRNKYTTLN